MKTEEDAASWEEERKVFLILASSSARHAAPSSALLETGQETSNPTIRLFMLPILLLQVNRGGKITLHVRKPGR